jgi:enoyl-CoA hydratase/carnithine racemase
MMSADSYNTILFERNKNVVLITLNRPEKSNAMSPELMADMAQALEQVSGDDTVRAVVITGAGKSFSAGGDIKKDIEPMGKMSVSEFDHFFHVVDRMYLTTLEMEKPVIAAINGYAVAGGLELALCCDVRIAAEDAQMGAIFVRMGLCPEISLYLLPRIVGLGMAKLLAMTGRIVKAHEAFQMGLVDILAPPEQMLQTAQDLARQLAQGPRAVGLIKKAINDSLVMDLKAFVTYSKRLTYELAHTEDHREALSAFLEKREPRFKGK